MRSRYNILFPLFAFILTASVQYCSASSHLRISTHNRNISNGTPSESKSNYTLNNPIESVPLLIRQMQKTVNSAHALFATPTDFSSCLKYYNFFSGSGKHQLVCSKKPLLFPFHGFW